MLAQDFRKLINLLEARDPSVQYDDATKVIAQLQQHQGGAVYNELAKKVLHIKNLEAEIKAMNNEIKQQTRETIANLFDAEDAVKTRVIETLEFIMNITKDPAPTRTPRYKDILEELTNHLTPELITVLETLKSTMVTVVEKAPGLSVKPTGLDEDSNNDVAELTNKIMAWGDQYDNKLAQLRGAF